MILACAPPKTSLIPKLNIGSDLDADVTVRNTVCTKFQVSRTSLSQKNLTNRSSRSRSRNGHDKSRGSNLISNSSQTKIGATGCFIKTVFFNV